MRALESIPTPGSLARWDHVLQIQTYPSFENYRAWALFVQRIQPTEKQFYQNPLVRQVTWDRNFDMQLFIDLLEGLKRGWNSNPTLETKDASLNHEALLALMEKGKTIQIPWLA